MMPTQMEKTISLIALAAMRNKKTFEKFLEEHKSDDPEMDEKLKQLKTMVEMDLIDEILRALHAPRGFEVADGFDPKEVSIPKRASVESAGYDIRSLDTVEIQPNTAKILNTGLKAFMPVGEVLLIYPRSSVGIKRHLMLANTTAVIDADYYGNPDNDGHIMLAIYNYGNEPQTIKKGERIAQGIFTEYKRSDDVPDKARTGGIGSTGK